MDSVPQDIPMKQCNTCFELQPRTAQFFEGGKKYGDGFRNQCRICHRAHRLVPKPEPVPEGMKRCNVCLNVLPATSEVFSVGNKTAFAAHCRKCHSRLWKEAHPPKRQYHIKDGMKFCPHCEEWKPLTLEFYHSSRTASFGFHSLCKVCRGLTRNKGRKPKKTAEENKLRVKQYKARNIEKLRIYSNIAKRNRRTRKKGVPGTYTPIQIQEQLKRQKYKCYYAACGHAKFPKVNGKYIYTVEHTFPIIRVIGTDIPANDISYIVLSCVHCNSMKRDKFPWEFPEGGRLM